MIFIEKKDGIVFNDIEAQNEFDALIEAKERIEENYTSYLYPPSVLNGLKKAIKESEIFPPKWYGLV
jgi:hypothetical protein